MERRGILAATQAGTIELNTTYAPPVSGAPDLTATTNINIPQESELTMGKLQVYLQGVSSYGNPYMSNMAASRLLSASVDLDPLPTDTVSPTLVDRVGPYANTNIASN